MSRLVLVSFAFLGWSFYELSGGKDFTPPEAPADNSNQIAAAPAVTETPSTSKFRQSAKVRAASLVATQVLQEAPPARPAPDPTHRQAVALEQIASAGAQLQISEQAFATPTSAPSAQVNVIQGGLAAITAQFDQNSGTRLQNAALAGAGTPAANPDSFLDIREIRASRVNMRQGPGTIYPVLARLLAGDEVIVIDDNGTGWLQLRTKDGNRIGWVAASLVGKKRS